MPVCAAKRKADILVATSISSSHMTYGTELSSCWRAGEGVSVAEHDGEDGNRTEAVVAVSGRGGTLGNGTDAGLSV